MVMSILSIILLPIRFKNKILFWGECQGGTAAENREKAPVHGKCLELPQVAPPTFATGPFALVAGPLGGKERFLRWPFAFPRALR